MTGRWEHYKSVTEPRLKAEAAREYVPTGDMREKIAAALYHAKPSFRIDKRLEKSMEYFQSTTNIGKLNAIEYADDLLIALDHLGLEIVDRNRE